MMTGGARSISALVALIGVSACTIPERNPILEPTPHFKGIDPRQGYRWPNIKRGGSNDETLVLVTASGGGARAAALALGVLRALDAIKTAAGGTVLDEVDIVSSVSGGSVTAGYFALRGRDGFDDLEQRFLKQDMMAAMAWRALNPVGLARLATPGYTRLDVQIDYLRDQLFGDATYQTLLEGDQRRPYLILNGSDITLGSVFPFTQQYFDLLCSDLRGVRLADAVSASAAFPVVLAPLALTNHAPCAVQVEEGEIRHWPPLWIGGGGSETDPYQNPLRARWERRMETYLNRDPSACGLDITQRCRPYVHLLDGGISDNLGVSEPYRLMTTTGNSPSLKNRILQGKITNVVFILVNARSEQSTTIDRSPEPPGALTMLNASIGTAVDSNSFSTIDSLHELLEGSFHNQCAKPGAQCGDFKVSMLPVDFDLIDDEHRGCRQAFKSISTTWTLPPYQVDALLALGGALLNQASAFSGLLRLYDAAPGTAADIDWACALLEDGAR